MPYYPLAGRVKERADGTGLEVTCHGQGAIFIDAVSDSSVSEFEAAPKCVAHWRKFLALHVADVLKGAPPLVVQLTWLSDGGATLAVGFNHCLCDGIGGGQFLNSFAKLASGKCGLGDQLSPSQSPTWSRHLLDVVDPFGMGGGELTSYSGHPEFKSVPDVCGFMSRYVQERLIPTSITFSKVQIYELKKVSKSTCTSFEVISALVWRSWVIAMDLPCSQIVKLVFSVNIRKRVKPSLPNGYYGNAFVLGCAQTNVKDLIVKGLGHVIQLVREAKERVREEYVREVVEAVSTSRASVDSIGVLVLTQWSRLGLESIDFGVGKPVQVGPVCCDKYCMLLPVSDQKDAIKVNLAVPDSAVDRYLQFLKSDYI